MPSPLTSPAEETLQRLGHERADEAADRASRQEETEADLVEAEKLGRSIVYRLKMSVLEEALLGFAQTFGWEMKMPQPAAKKAPRPVRGES